MLSYQHAYHAGNMADVHKHALLAWALDYMVQKDKPLSYWESHAGRGLYALDSAEAAKTGEAAAGIARVRGWFPADHPYARVLARVRAEYGDAAYPGSPLIAALSLRDTDRLQLSELHPQEFATLADLMVRSPAHVQQKDGLATALSQLPPDPRRGFLLIDPSYEVKAEYEAVAETLIRVHRKWPVGVLMLWYPLIEGAPHEAMLDRLQTAIPDGFRHEVRFPPARPGHRMTGSGIFFVNPPYGLEDEARWLSGRFATLSEE